MNKLPATAFDFLKELSRNNNKPWFVEHKEQFDRVFGDTKSFFKDIYEEMQTQDHLERFHVHRIYRDVRFSKDKTPYKEYFGLHLGRSKPLFRGGYYLNIEPGKSFVGGGFWEPDKNDLLRIRKDIEQDDSEFRSLIQEPKFIAHFGGLSGEELKTAPKGFDKEHPAIDLLRKKQFLVMRSFTDQQVLSEQFKTEVIDTFKTMRPWFDYMSEVLTTDANGVSLY